MPEHLKITSRTNERLTRLRKARDGKLPGQLFIEGARLAEEAARSDLDLSEGVFTPSFAGTDRGGELIVRLDAAGVRLAEASEGLFSSIADTANSQGIALTGRRPLADYEGFKLKLEEPRLALFLWRVNDPSNLGAILRTAEAAGVAGVALSPGSADAFSPKALRSGMGANLRVPIWEKAIVSEVVEWTRSCGMRLIAADARGSEPYTRINWKLPSCIIFGSEAHGLDEEILAVVDSVASIPMSSEVESLNLAVSAGIIMFEAVRQNA